MSRNITVALVGGCVLLVLVVLVGGGTMTGGSFGDSMMGNAWTGHAGMSGLGWTGILLVLVVGVAALLLLGNRGTRA